MTMRTLTNILLYIWQLPQNLLGLAFRALFFKPWKQNMTTYENNGSVIVTYYHSPNMKGGLTLGEYIFVKSYKSYRGIEYADNDTIQHEHGHVIQSRILGPLFLLVIGLPSLIHASLHSAICRDKNYYHFYTERWANRLSGK